MSQSLLQEFIVTELIDIAGPEDVSVAEVDRLVYSTDFFWLPQMWLDRGLRPPAPDVIVHPESTQEVARILQVASTHRIPVIPYGGGTGSQGALLPLYGGIMLDMKKMDRILKIDDQSFTVTAQPGINGQRLEDDLNARGLTLAHYPASQYGATLGGYLAARGSGTLSTKYGKAEDMVLALEVVLASGQAICPCRITRWVPDSSSSSWVRRARSASLPRPPCALSRSPRSGGFRPTSSRALQSV